MMAGKYSSLSNLPLPLAARAGQAGAVTQDSATVPAVVAPRPDPGSRLASPPRAGPGLGAYAALAVVWVVWGSTYTALRVSDESIPPLAMAAARYMVAGAVLYPFARRIGNAQERAADRPSARQWLATAVVGTMLLAFGNSAVAYAEKTIPSGQAALLVASVPLWMVLADRVINGRRLPAVAWLALAAGIAGIAILAKPHGHGAVLPVLIVLGGALSWGTGSVLAGRLPMPARPLLASAMEMLTGSVVLVLLAAATGELGAVHPSAVTGRSLLALLYLIGPGSLLAMTCYVLALQRLPTATVSTYAYVNPVIAVGLGALLLGERLTMTTLAGGAVVVGCVALLLVSRSRETPDAQLPDAQLPDAQLPDAQLPDAQLPGNPSGAKTAWAGQAVGGS
jgi:drug/metabolite transporter (DMT)-like permease